jgi:hypothetical protein
METNPQPSHRSKITALSRHHLLWPLDNMPREEQPQEEPEVRVSWFLSLSLRRGKQPTGYGDSGNGMAKGYETGGKITTVYLEGNPNSWGATAMQSIAKAGTGDFSKIFRVAVGYAFSAIHPNGDFQKRTKDEILSGIAAVALCGRSAGRFHRQVRVFGSL